MSKYYSICIQAHDHTFNLFCRIQFIEHHKVQLLSILMLIKLMQIFVNKLFHYITVLQTVIKAMDKTECVLHQCF